MSHAKDVGNKFEYDIRDQINELGKPKEIFATRIWYSGAGLQKPYDVEVRKGEPADSPVVLEIEAKRRIRGKSLALGPKELDIVSDKHVIVLAVGRYSGRSVPVYVLHNDTPLKRQDLEPNKTHRVLRAKPGAKTVCIGTKWVGPAQPAFILEGWGKRFMVEGFEEFIKRWLEVNV